MVSQTCSARFGPKSSATFPIGPSRSNPNGARKRPCREGDNPGVSASRRSQGSVPEPSTHGRPTPPPARGCPRSCSWTTGVESPCGATNSPSSAIGGEPVPCLIVETLDRGSRALEQNLRSFSDDDPVHHMKRQAMIAGTTIESMQVYEILRSLELLRGLPGIDPSSIAMLGKGVDGVNAMYAALLDGEVKASDSPRTAGVPSPGAPLPRRASLHRHRGNRGPPSGSGPGLWRSTRQPAIRQDLPEPGGVSAMTSSFLLPAFSLFRTPP